MQFGHGVVAINAYYQGAWDVTLTANNPNLKAALSTGANVSLEQNSVLAFYCTPPSASSTQFFQVTLTAGVYAATYQVSYNNPYILVTSNLIESAFKVTLSVTNGEDFVIWVSITPNSTNPVPVLIQATNGIVSIFNQQTSVNQPGYSPAYSILVPGQPYLPCLNWGQMTSSALINLGYISTTSFIFFNLNNTTITACGQTSNNAWIAATALRGCNALYVYAPGSCESGIISGAVGYIGS